MILMNRGLAANICSPRLFVDVCLLIHVLQGMNSSALPMSMPLCPEGGVYRGCVEGSGRVLAVSSALFLRTTGGQM